MTLGQNHQYKQLYNPGFKGNEFVTFKSQTGLTIPTPERITVKHAK